MPSLFTRGLAQWDFFFPFFFFSLLLKKTILLRAAGQKGLQPAPPWWSPAGVAVPRLNSRSLLGT